ncbi:hypothetical protein CAPTEDRAFT_207985 [Capitella teleta]|uniref:G-protein coupled receptors family 1 profile domain-containing protein n=1 Tax=Capitella teleta TaxID=283909 RepID=R7TM58_CAPTE|nr:hypothetical protein CAPTEDRAFT_207985 [Capitella teleta]|eukprot:ELT94729.1 hypothetical protein CAPTEDRAFT_207985 [Capitella teleta]
MNTEATASSTEDQEAIMPTLGSLSLAQLKQCNDYYIVSAAFIGAFVLLGLVGNSLTVYIFRNASNQTSTMYLICNLAVVDVMVTLLFLPVALPPSVGTLSIFYIAYVSNLAYTLNQISIFFTTILVWQRYISVCKPHDVKYWTKVSVLRGMSIAAVILSIGVYAPGFLKYTVNRTSAGQFVVQTTRVGSNPIFYYLHTVGIMNLISYVIPVSVISYATIRLIQSLRDKTALVSSQRARRDLTKSVVVIVILFIVLQSFRPVRYILLSVFNPYSMAISCQGPLMYFAPIPPFVTILNSSVNFLIYVICAKRFRQKIAAIICGRLNRLVPESISGATNLDQ